MFLIIVSFFNELPFIDGQKSPFICQTICLNGNKDSQFGISISDILDTCKDILLLKCNQQEL